YADGLLSTIKDIDDRITEIQRDADGNATAIVSPDGHETDLTMDVDGNLEKIRNPLNQVVLIEYHEDEAGPNGLISKYINGNGDESTYSYDPLGRLNGWTDASGTQKTIQETAFQYKPNFDRTLELTVNGTRKTSYRRLYDYA